MCNKNNLEASSVIQFVQFNLRGIFFWERPFCHVITNEVVSSWLKSWGSCGYGNVFWCTSRQPFFFWVKTRCYLCYIFARWRKTELAHHMVMHEASHDAESRHCGQGGHLIEALEGYWWMFLSGNTIMISQLHRYWRQLCYRVLQQYFTFWKSEKEQTVIIVYLLRKVFVMATIH